MADDPTGSVPTAEHDDAFSGDGEDAVGPTKPDNSARRETRLIGVGLLASIVVGFGPLRDAMVGNGSFEGALARYLLCLGFSVGSMVVLGRLLNGAQPEEEEAADGRDGG